MRALSFLGMVFSAFLLILGFSSKKTAGDVLANALIVGGIIIAVFVAAVTIIVLLKERKEK